MQPVPRFACSMAGVFGRAVALVALAAGAAGCADATTGGDGGNPPSVDMTCTGKCLDPDWCQKDGDCAPPAPFCDVSRNKCVACLRDTDCGPGRVCNLASHTCAAGCGKDHGCGPDAGQCELDAGVCVECLRDGDCKADPTKTRCDAVQHRCFACNPTNDNCGHATYCGLKNDEYVCISGCKGDPDCNDPPPDSGTGDGGAPPQLLHCDAPSHMCVECTADAHCPPGRVCKGDTCVAGCTLMHACGNGLACCGMPGMMACTDTTSDSFNCGGCGAQCQGGWNCCNSGCSNPLIDVLNCGFCGTVCKVDHGTPTCDKRTCAIARCDQGWADCAGGYLDGCETHIDVNLNNCGGCNNMCALPNVLLPKCVAGTCQVGTCLPGWANCNNKPEDGCEIQIASDPNNCGGCGNFCSASNVAQRVCANNQCTGVCVIGFADCDQNKLTNGCEVDLNNDKTNCGKCGNNCDMQCVGNTAATACSKGICGVTACGNGFYDIDGLCANGCECRSAPAGATSCGNALNLGTIQPGGAAIIASGNMVGAVTDAWFKVTFQDDLKAATYHPKVIFTNNPGNAFVFDVNVDCLGSKLTCALEQGQSDGRTQWEKFYQAPVMGNTYDPASPGWAPIPPVGNNGAVLVHVYRAFGKPITCDAFAIAFSN